MISSRGLAHISDTMYMGCLAETYLFYLLSFSKTPKCHSTYSAVELITPSS